MIIIVARYNEDMKWTKQFPNVIIYTAEHLKRNAPKGRLFKTLAVT